MTLRIVDWTRARHLASGILIAAALVTGGIIGNVLLLGSADHAGDPVGHLSIQTGSRAPAATATRALDDGPSAPTTGTPIAPVRSSRSAHDDSGDVFSEGRSPDD